jgi:DNA invertase Pin-like site-specific DNA recombinase
MQGLDIRDLENPTTRLTLQILSMMAEHERSCISQRTKEALRILKAKGIHVGKPKGILQYSMFDQHKAKIKEWCRMGLPYAQQARILKCSVMGIRRYVITRRIFRNSNLNKGFNWVTLKRMKEANKGKIIRDGEWIDDDSKRDTNEKNNKP